MSSYVFCLLLAVCLCWQIVVIESSSITVLGNTTLYITTESEVYDIQEDLYLPGNILFSDSRTLKTADENVSSAIVGNSRRFSGYSEGVGDNATFYGITSMVQMNRSTVVVVDCWNHCLRTVNRLTNSTGWFAGNCTQNGFKNSPLAEAMFFYPYSVARAGSYLLVADTYNMAIRAISITDTNPFVSTVTKGGILKYPRFIALDTSSNMYITVMDGIVKIDSNSNVPTALTQLDRGLVDGPVNQSKFYYPQQLSVLPGGLLLVVDGGNKCIRSLDLKSGTVTTLLDLESKITRSLLVTDGKLLIGALQKILQVDVLVDGLESTTPSGKITPVVPLTFLREYTTPAVRTVTAFTARYAVTCSLLNNGAAAGMLRAVIQYRYNIITRICAQDCVRNQNKKKPSYKCQYNELNVYWPVEVKVKTNQTNAVKRLNYKLQTQVRKEGISKFSVTVINQSPAVVSPKIACDRFLELFMFTIGRNGELILPSDTIRCL